MSTNVIHFVHHGFKTPTKEVRDLRRELRTRGIKVYTELYDGYKHIDLALPDARLNVEVDGIQHLTNPKQIVADLNRSYHSNNRDYATMHIPNEMIRLHLEEIAGALAEASKIRERKIKIHITK